MNFCSDAEKFFVISNYVVISPDEEIKIVRIITDSTNLRDINNLFPQIKKLECTTTSHTIEKQLTFLQKLFPLQISNFDKYLYFKNLRDLYLINSPNLRKCYFTLDSIENFYIEKCPNIRCINLNLGRNFLSNFEIDTISKENWGFYRDFIEKCKKCNIKTWFDTKSTIPVIIDKNYVESAIIKQIFKNKTKELIGNDMYLFVRMSLEGYEIVKSLVVGSENLGKFFRCDLDMDF